MIPSSSFCFVDTETTGTHAAYGKIIEIGMIKVVDGKVVETYNTLLNPQMHLDPFIENLTGIKATDLQTAPLFEEVQEKIFDMLSDSIFVAHNARFDYGFLRQEFKRVGKSWSSKQLCTVKLSRLLYPNLGRYNLDAIMTHFNISCTNRHRALDDAKVMHEFFTIAQEQIEPSVFEKAIDTVLKKPTIPLTISVETLDTLPETPGVYIFYGENNTPLYIGKSIHLRDRILSHFSSDYLSNTDMKISQQVVDIQTIPTAGELGALLLESTLVKKMQPLFNRKLRYARKMTILMKTQNENGYNSVEVHELDSVDVKDIERIIGVYKSKKQLKDFLYELARTHNLCPKLLGIEKTKSACFFSQLGHCFGACTQEEVALKYNLRFDEAFYRHKIRPWNFDKPIVIHEKGETEELFVIDKWCYLGSLKSEADTLENIEKEYIFDFDVYKILSKFLLDPKNQHSVRYL